MLTNPIGALMGLLCCLLLMSCTSGPSPADVAADRDRMIAVFDVTADNAIDENERPVLNELIATWNAKIEADEAAIAQRDTTVQDLIRVYGLAAVQLWVAPELQRRSPQLFALIDKDSSGTLEEAELLAVDPKSPVFAAVVLTTAAQLIAKHRSG